jgi:nitroreductase
MKTNLDRRSFLKKNLLLSGALSVLPFSSFKLVANEKKNISTGLPEDKTNETIKTIKNLRTIHGNFTEKLIPEEQIEQILHASVRAANASAIQSYSIIVTKDREKMKNICGYAGGCLFLYCVDINRLKSCAKLLGYDYVPDNMPSFMAFSVSTIAAAQTAVIAAKSLGIDSLMTNGIHRDDMERLWKILELPQTFCFPLIAVVFGYPTEEPAHLKGRLEGAGVIHHEKYHNLTSEETKELIEKYDNKDLHLSLIDDWKEQGFKHYMDWLFSNWLGRNNKPATSESQLFKIMKKCGFVDLQKS